MDQSKQKPGQPAAQHSHHEQRNVENSAVYLLPRLHAAKDKNPKLRVLDVGAGSGTISIGFAKLLPEGQVTAVDLKDDIFPRARSLAEAAGVTNIEFQQADVFKLPFEDATFDITHCHQMLAHVKAPSDALREMLRVTKLGGFVAAREGDLDTEAVWPALPGVVKFHNFTATLMKAGGGSSSAGRQLVSWALQAGAERAHITASFGTWTYSTPAERETWAYAMMEYLRGGRMRAAALAMKLATEDELEDMAVAWDEWTKRDDGILSMMQGEIIIEK